MVLGHVKTVRCESGYLSYRDAVHIAKDVCSESHLGMVVLDLDATLEATTAAFARLIVLRRRLLSLGGDLHILHLHGRARHIYEINRMESLLPCE